ncbi:hypothetical protein L1N85_16130 [Paenibacillus alkaliterrae]|uniref:hypothetical protein n=1 Tax=Paenibacillus alkaliterrae TaxID=320909 RepID=UPI001F1E0B8E|nr:hypothetical protein [Paenibacillus alkaliterrae]MCF2939946.1 hypothetical protein [Paenibacillus alkaliterrae]
MNSNTQKRLLDFLKLTFDYDGAIHFLALSAKESSSDAENQTTRFKLRLALTFRESDTVCPYFDGTELSVDVSPEDIRFADEDEWADGPPIMEGSPNELALSWVSKLAPPFFVSPEAQEAASNASISTREMNPDVEMGKFF